MNIPEYLKQLEQQLPKTTDLSKIQHKILDVLLHPRFLQDSTLVQSNTPNFLVHNIVTGLMKEHQLSGDVVLLEYASYPVVHGMVMHPSSMVAFIYFSNSNTGLMVTNPLFSSQCTFIRFSVPNYPELI
jgi:hypothetical protein